MAEKAHVLPLVLVLFTLIRRRSRMLLARLTGRVGRGRAERRKRGESRAAFSLMNGARGVVHPSVHLPPPSLPLPVSACVAGWRICSAGYALVHALTGLSSPPRTLSSLCFVFVCTCVWVCGRVRSWHIPALTCQCSFGERAASRCEALPHPTSPSRCTSAHPRTHTAAYTTNHHHNRR